MLWVSGARRSDGAMFKKKKKVTILFRLCERRRSDGRTQPGGFFLLIQIQKGPRLFVAVIFSSFFQFSAFRNQQSSSPKFHMRTTRTKYYIYDYFLKKDWSPSCKVSSALISGGGRRDHVLTDPRAAPGCGEGFRMHGWKLLPSMEIKKNPSGKVQVRQVPPDIWAQRGNNPWKSEAMRFKKFFDSKTKSKTNFFLGE